MKYSLVHQASKRSLLAVSASSVSWTTSRRSYSVLSVSTLSQPLAPSTAPRPSAGMMIRFVEPPRSWFHSTSHTQLPVRRRRRPSSGRGGTTTSTDEQSEDGPSDNNPLKHTPVQEDIAFVQAASALFDKLLVGLTPMQTKNDPFIVTRSFVGDAGELLTIDLGPKEGTYRMEMSLDEYMMEYTSPISGKVLYVLSQSTGEWVGSEDGHVFEGLLVRDLIRQCQGLPKL